MAAESREFSISLERFANELFPEQLQRLQQALALEALTRLILASPVDEGRFRANWQVSRGGPAAGEIDVFFTGDREARAAAAARLAIDQGIVEVQKIEAYEVTFIVNNVPYAVALSAGHSPQAPPGWVDAIVEGLALWVENQAPR